MNQQTADSDIARCSAAYVQAVQEPDAGVGQIELHWASEATGSESRVHVSFELRGNYLVRADYTVTDSKVLVHSIRARHISTILRIDLPCYGQSRARITVDTGEISAIPTLVAQRLLRRTMSS